jgi:transcription antitermination factor NusG
MERKWLVFYTKSRHEMKVSSYLQRRGYEVFLPVQKVLRQWSDRKKRVTTPLFKSYVFVCDTESRIQDILQVPGVAWNVRYNNRPAVLREKEIETIKRFLATGLLVETSMDPKFQVGDDAEVVDGPLKGVRGKIIDSPDGDKFSVTLEVLGNSMIVRLDARMLARITR